MKRMNYNNGFAALTSILAISAVVLAIAVSISLLGISEAKNSLSFRRGLEAHSATQGCVEEALLRLRNDPDYAGALSVGDLNCTIAVSGTGSDRTITVESTITGQPQYKKRIQTTLKRIGNSVNIVSWSETN